MFFAGTAGAVDSCAPYLRTYVQYLRHHRRARVVWRDFMLLIHAIPACCCNIACVIAYRVGTRSLRQVYDRYERSHWPHCQGTRTAQEMGLGSRICSCALARCAPQLLARRWTWSWTRVRMPEDGQLGRRNSLLCRVCGQARLELFLHSGHAESKRGVEIG